jgi:thiol-disulfide isomerase/thioredoxin
MLLAIVASVALHTMYDASDYAGAVDTGRAIVASSPDDLELRAWYIANVAALDFARGRAMAAAMRDAHPESPWSWLAMAYTSDGNPVVARDIAAKLAGQSDEDFVIARARMLGEANDRAAALALLSANRPRMLVTKGWLLRDKRETEQQALDAFAEARKLDPSFVPAWYQAAVLLSFERRTAEAKPLLEEAARLSPYSARVHQAWWEVIDDKQVIREDADRLVRERGFEPMVLLQAASGYRKAGRDDLACAMAERVLREAPMSEAAIYAISSTLRENKDPAAQRLIWRDLLDYPYRVPDSIASAAAALLRLDPKLSDAEVVRLAHAIEPVYGNGTRINTAVLALVDRKLDLDYAAELARKLPQVISDEYIDVPESDYPRAVIHDATGWLLLARGHAKEAERELTAAYGLYPRVPQFAYHLGRAFEAEGKLARAEQVYREGVALQSAAGVNPNRAALEALYKRRHKTLRSFDAYLKQVTATGTSANKEKILSARAVKPIPAPAFRLKSLKGSTVSLADLQGKVAVINFWAVWCGWCVREMPDLARLAQKYAGDPDVRVLTIDVDQDPETVRKWMSEKKLDFPVLLDDGFVHRAGVDAFPTTWFLDRKGRIAFDVRGWSEKLIDEYGWRIEALR